MELSAYIEKTPRPVSSSWVLVLWVFLLVGIPALGLLIYSGMDALGIPAYLSRLMSEISHMIRSLSPPPDPNSLSTRLMDRMPALSMVSQQILFILYVLLGLAGLFEAIAQFRRNKDLGKVKGNSIHLNRLQWFSTNETQKELLHQILDQTDIRTTVDLIKFAGPKKGRESLAYTLLPEEEWTSKDEQEKNTIVEEKTTRLTEVAMIAELMRIEDVSEEFAKTLIENNIQSIDALSNLVEFPPTLNGEKIDGLKKQAKKLESLFN